MLRRNERRLNFKNRPVGTRDLKGGPKQPPPLATNRGSQELATNRVKALGPVKLSNIALCLNGVKESGPPDDVTVKAAAEW